MRSNNAGLADNHAPILVTGGAGFIGSNFVLDWLAAGLGPVVNLDKLTYAGNPANLASARNSCTREGTGIRHETPLRRIKIRSFADC